jgi:pyruvate formate lyase activating enzyme
VVKIAGVGSSSIDYPNGFCGMIFTKDCNLRCPYCHNWSLFKENKPATENLDYVLTKFYNNKRLISNITISGGEPTLYDDLPELIGTLRKNGYHIKLDTNGTNPKMLEEIIYDIDYVALDIKTSLDRYNILGAKEDYSNRILESINLLKIYKPYTHCFRTTVVPIIVTERDIINIGKMLNCNSKFVLQQFKPFNAYNPSYRKITPYPTEKLSEFRDILLKFNFKSVDIVNI